jgi:hypoxanthine-DNA glycosylase
VQYIKHTFAPVYDKNSKILILGTIPSPKSRENGFYYSHPQNKFWKILAEIFFEKIPFTITEKKSLLLRRHIALWDVLQSCYIENADDSSIKEPIVNDISQILYKSNINVIFTTGKKSYSLYKKYCEPQIRKKAIYLPSTSPANCIYSYTQIKNAYLEILKY